MTTYGRALPEPTHKDKGGADHYPLIWVKVGAASKYEAKNGQVVFGLDVDGPRDGWWTFKAEDAHLAVSGAQLQVALKTKSIGDGKFYQDVFNVARQTDVQGEIQEVAGADQAAIARGVQMANDGGGRDGEDRGWRPGIEDEAQDDPLGPGPETHQDQARDVAEARQTHRPRTGPDWQDEPPSFHTWRERGIQKMSALKASVEWLNSAPERLREFGDDEALRGVYGGRISDVEELAWRLMRELADGKPVTE